MQRRVYVDIVLRYIKVKIVILLNEVVVLVVIRSRHDYLIEKCLANN